MGPLLDSFNPRPEKVREGVEATSCVVLLGGHCVFTILGLSGGLGLVIFSIFTCVSSMRNICIIRGIHCGRW